MNCVELAPPISKAYVGRVDKELNFQVQVIPSNNGGNSSPEIVGQKFLVTSESYYIRRNYEDFRYFNKTLIEVLEKEFAIIDGEIIHESLGTVGNIPRFPEMAENLTFESLLQEAQYLESYINEVLNFALEIYQHCPIPEFFGNWAKDSIHIELLNPDSAIFQVLERASIVERKMIMTWGNNIQNEESFASLQKTAEDNDLEVADNNEVRKSKMPTFEEFVSNLAARLGINNQKEDIYNISDLRSAVERDTILEDGLVNISVHDREDEFNRDTIVENTYLSAKNQYRNMQPLSAGNESKKLSYKQPISETDSFELNNFRKERSSVSLRSMGSRNDNSDVPTVKNNILMRRRSSSDFEMSIQPPKIIIPSRKESKNWLGSATSSKGSKESPPTTNGERDITAREAIFTLNSATQRRIENSELTSDRMSNNSSKEKKKSILGRSNFEKRNDILGMKRDDSLKQHDIQSKSSTLRRMQLQNQNDIQSNSSILRNFQAGKHKENRSKFDGQSPLIMRIILPVGKPIYYELSRQANFESFWESLAVAVGKLPSKSWKMLPPPENHKASLRRIYYRNQDFDLLSLQNEEDWKACLLDASEREKLTLFVSVNEK